MEKNELSGHSTREVFVEAVGEGSLGGEVAHDQLGRSGVDVGGEDRGLLAPVDPEGRDLGGQELLADLELSHLLRPERIRLSVLTVDLLLFLRL